MNTKDTAQIANKVRADLTKKEITEQLKATWQTVDIDLDDVNRSHDLEIYLHKELSRSFKKLKKTNPNLIRSNIDGTKQR